MDESLADPRRRTALPATGGAAERDALAIVERAAADERAAEELRLAIRAEGLPRVVEDESIRRHLSPGEGVVEVRDAVVVERIHGDGATETLSARLYLTTERLVLLGAEVSAIPLAAIEELSLAGERLLVSLRDGSGLRLDAGWPRLLRVQVAAARAEVDA